MVPQVSTTLHKEIGQDCVMYLTFVVYSESSTQAVHLGVLNARKVSGLYGNLVSNTPIPQYNCLREEGRRSPSSLFVDICHHGDIVQ